MNSGTTRLDEWQPAITTHTRVLQIIVGALITGVLAFAGFVVFTGALQQPPKPGFLSQLAVVMAAINVALHAIIPSIIERSALANQSVGSGVPQLLGVFQTRTIIAAALLEGAALFATVTVMIEHQSWVLVVTGVLLLLLLLQFPTTTRVEQWLETRLMDQDVGRT
jgi:hypothetical protein